MEAQGSDAELSDETLVEQCQRELPYNATAFEVLVRRHEPVVYQTCLRYVGNSADAEETTQDVFMKVFRHLPSFEGKAQFKTWLFRIVQNECASRYRRLKRRREQAERYHDSVRGDSLNGVPEAVDDGFGDAVNAALGRLSEDDRTVLVLRYVGDLSLADISQTLQISLSAAKMRLYRAQDRFQETYRPEGSVL